MTVHYYSRISPFGYLRVIGYLLLTAAFRSLSRPSSAPSAKAFTLCPSSLDLSFVFALTALLIALRSNHFAMFFHRFSSRFLRLCIAFIA